MKTKRTIALLVVVLGLLLGRDALAFYNPSTGRWLNRDPIGERGGLNVHAYVENQAVSGIDALGNESCKCGPDVTAALTRTLDNVDWIFKLWDDKQAKSACRELIDLGGGAGSAWDIPYLASIGFRRPTHPCDRTVTFKGKCYYGGAANYALWGKAFRLCGGRFGDPWNLENALILAAAWKIWNYGWGDEELQALAFTGYGYSGLLLHGGIPRCVPNSNPVRNYAFRWRWMPVKPS